MDKSISANTNNWLHRFAVLTAVATFLLLGAGGLVTSHDAGMSVPDWPNSYGYNMFLFPFSKWIGGIFFEHIHRLIASFTGLLTIALACWLWAFQTKSKIRRVGIIAIGANILFVVLAATGLQLITHYQSLQHDMVLKITQVSWISVGVIELLVAGYCLWKFSQNVNESRWLGMAGVAAVILQGVLGGLRVTMQTDSLGIFHGVLGQSFFILICAIALFTSRFWFALAARQPQDFVPRGLRSHVLYVTILIFLQLVLGATMRHQHAGLAISDFPLAHGQIWPDTTPAAIVRYNAERMDVVNQNPITAFQVILQMIHRLGAVLIFLGVAAAAGLSMKRLGKKDLLTKFAFFWLGLIVIQIALGIETIWSNKAADIATAHVLVGALSLVTGALWCIIARARKAPVTETDSSPAFNGQPSLAGAK